MRHSNAFLAWTIHKHFVARRCVWESSWPNSCCVISRILCPSPRQMSGVSSKIRIDFRGVHETSTPILPRLLRASCIKSNDENKKQLSNSCLYIAITRTLLAKTVGLELSPKPEAGSHQSTGKWPRKMCVPRSAKVDAPGCVNAVGKLGQKW